MPEKFRVDGAFGDGTAVDGEIRSVLASGEGVNNLREMLFADTRFPCYKDAKVGLCHLQGNLYTTIEQRTVADNAEPLFDML